MGLELLRKHGFAVNAAMMIHRENKNCLRDTANFLAEYGVRTLRLNSPQKSGNWIENAGDNALTEDEVWDIYRRYIDDFFADGMPIGVQLDGYFICDKGSTDYRIAYVKHTPEDIDWSKTPYCGIHACNVYISPEGRTIPCMGFSDTALAEKFRQLCPVGLPGGAAPIHLYLIPQQPGGNAHGPEKAGRADQFPALPDPVGVIVLQEPVFPALRADIADIKFVHTITVP
jgi:hypothetical protein